MSKKVLIKKDVLKFKLKLKKMKLKDLMDLLGIGRSTLYLWINSPTSLENARLIAHYLECDVEELIECNC